MASYCLAIPISLFVLLIKRDLITLFHFHRFERTVIFMHEFSHLVHKEAYWNMVVESTSEVVKLFGVGQHGLSTTNFIRLRQIGIFE